MSEVKAAFKNLNTELSEDDVGEIVSKMDADDSGEVKHL